MAVWYGLVVSQILEGVVRRFVEEPEINVVDFEDNVIELAEPLASVMDGLDLWLPQNDASALVVIRRDGVRVPVDLMTPGLALENVSGGLCVSIGGGMVVEASGPELCIVVGPALSRYVGAWRFPDVSYLVGR